ncbi:MFS transporter, partial [Chloroflexota bacterium]
EGGLEAPLTGWFVDKYGPRWVIFIGICIAASGLLLMNFVNSLLAYYLVWGFITGTGINLSLTIAVDKTLTNWFISKRGLAQGIKFALIGILGVIVLPIVTWEVVEQGWRVTCMVWGGILLACAPFSLLFVKQKRPEYYGLLPDGATVESGPGTNIDGMIDRGVEYASGFQEIEFTLKQAIKTPAYWLIVAAFGGHTIVFGGFTIHCIPFLTDMGIEPTVAGAMMGLMIFFTVPSRFFSGFLADRVGKNRMKLLLAGSFLLQGIGIGTFLLNQTIATVYVLLILYGFGSGAATPLYILILGRYFGRKAYGSIHGSTALLRAPVQLIAPVYAGWVYDTTGSYTTAFTIFAAIAFISAIFIYLAVPPKQPTYTSGINQFV